MKYCLKSLVVAAVAATFAGSSFAQNVYAFDGNNNDLCLVNVTNGNTTVLGNTGVFLESLAYQQGTGRLFGHDTSGTLYELNAANGAVINSMTTGLGNVEGLDFVSGGGILYGFDFANPGTIHTIDWNTGANSPFVTMNQSNGVVRGFAFDPTDTFAYFAGDNPTFQTLSRMDASGNTTAIGTLSVFTAALEFVGGTLYALDTAGKIYTVSTTDASMSFVADTGAHGWLGVAEAGLVPEPASMAALGLGVAALLRRRRK